LAFAFLSLYASNEDVFSHLSPSLDPHSLVGHLIKSDHYANPTVRILCVRFLASVCRFPHSAAWIASSGVWKSGLVDNMAHPSFYVANEARGAVVDLMITSSDIFCSSVASEIRECLDGLHRFGLSRDYENRRCASYCNALSQVYEKAIRDGPRPDWLTEEAMLDLHVRVSRLLVEPMLGSWPQPMVPKLYEFVIMSSTFMMIRDLVNPDKSQLSFAWFTRALTMSVSYCVRYNRLDLLSGLSVTSHRAADMLKRNSSPSRLNREKAIKDYEFRDFERMLTSVHVAPMLAYCLRYSDTAHAQAMTQTAFHWIKRTGAVSSNLSHDVEQLAKTKPVCELTKVIITFVNDLKKIGPILHKECAGISVMLTLAIVDIQADDRVPCSHPLQTACIALLMDLMQDYEGILHGGIEPSSLVEIMSSLCLRQGAGVAIVSKALKAVQAAFKRNSITRRVPFSKSEPAGFLANALRHLVTSRDWALRDSASRL
jgi:hypothetical protein